MGELGVVTKNFKYSMEIVTVMNYDSPQGVAMCKIWFYLMKRYNPKAHITVFYRDKISEVAEFGSRFLDVEFIQLDLSGDFLTYDRMGGVTVPSQDLTLGAWRWIEKNHLDKFICVEADAWCFTPLDEFWQLADEKPYIGIQECLREGPMVNAGVYSYNSAEGFLSYSRLMEQYRIDGLIRRGLGDQWLVNGYFHRIGYDFSHPKIGFEYNSLAIGCDVKTVNDDEIIVHSAGKMPRHKTYVDGTTAKLPMGIGCWSWWGHRKRVKILHSWYKKFWELPECQGLWEYGLKKVAEIEHAV